MQQCLADILWDIPFFDIESVVITGVNLTTVPVIVVAVAFALPKPGVAPNKLVFPVVLVCPNGVVC